MIDAIRSLVAAPFIQLLGAAVVFATAYVAGVELRSREAREPTDEKSSSAR